MVFLRVFDFGCFWMGCLCLGFTSLRFCVVVCDVVCLCGLEFWDRCFVRGVVVVLPVGC